jgi:hypothetical protein
MSEIAIYQQLNRLVVVPKQSQAQSITQIVSAQLIRRIVFSPRSLPSSIPGRCILCWTGWFRQSSWITAFALTTNIRMGITAGSVLYLFCNLVAGRSREIKPELWVLAGLSLLFSSSISTDRTDRGSGAPTPTR